MKISTTLAEVDAVCDYFPPVAPITNLIDLFLKCVVKCLPEKTVNNNRFWTHIRDKDISRCIVLLVPVLGQIYVVIKDYLEYKGDKKECDALIELEKSNQRLQANFAAISARFTSGVDVSSDQMMPAPTEDQQCLWAACLGDNTSEIRKLLQKGISPSFYHSGNTPLATACGYSTAETVRLLIEHGAEVNTPDRLGNTPFGMACSKGNLEIVQLLHPYIQDINASNAKGITPLMFASSGGDRDTIAFLREQGADPHKAAQEGSTAITCAICPSDHADLLPMLFDEDENIDAHKYQFQMPGLFFAPRIQGLTPLLYASFLGAVNSAKYLLTRSDVRCSDSLNNTALHYSVKDMEFIRAVLDKCSDLEFINQQNISNSTALHKAIDQKQPEAALLLLESGADPLIDNEEGTALQQFGLQ